MKKKMKLWTNIDYIKATAKEVCEAKALADGGRIEFWIDWAINLIAGDMKPKEAQFIYDEAYRMESRQMMKFVQEYAEQWR